MNWLDENFPDDQRTRLVQWRVPHRRAGREVAWRGAQDSDLLPPFHSARGVTYFTLDEDFFNRRLCHQGHCLAWLEPTEEVQEIVEVYVARRVMPADPLGDALHLALASHEPERSISNAQRSTFSS